MANSADGTGCYPMEIDNGSPDQPAALDNIEEEVRKCKALCYEDITLWIVQNPQPGGRDLLAMEVFLRNHKGVDNKPKPTVFLFRENNLPILCPVSHIMARAIRDDAILVEGWNKPETFFATDLRRMSRPAMRVNWKPEWLKRPVFRQSEKVKGVWVKSQTEPFPYSKYNFYTKRLGIAVGLVDILTSYCFRRVTLNAVDDVATDAVRDQIARQKPLSGTFNGAYINERVRLNVQDAYLESEVTEDGLTRAFTHMSIRSHPDAPTKAPSELVRQLVDADPGVASLQQECDQKHRQIKGTYRFIKHAPKAVRQEYSELKKRLKNEKKSIEDELHVEYRKDYDFRAHNEMMKMQLNPSAIQESSSCRPIIQHQLIERTQLQQVLCDFSKNLTSQEVISRKVAAIKLWIALASRRELQTHQPRRPPAACENTAIKQEPPSPAPQPQLEEFPLICKKTQCILCLGDTRVSYEQRTRTFSRVSHMMTHVQNVHHLDLLPTNQPVICVHPACVASEIVLENKEYFKNHVKTVHGIKLRC